MLVPMGFEVREAANGRDGLSLLCATATAAAAEPPAVALVDWNMPEMSGLELVTAARADRELDHVLIVMVTSETELDQVVRALDAGANEYVMKPFTADVLREKLALIGVGVAAAAATGGM